jgi:MFS family permease
VKRDPLFTGPFFRLFAFNFITFFCAFQLFPTIPFRIMALGGSTAAAGRFLAIYTWACAIAAPLTGTVADHLGRRRALIVSAAAFILFSFLYGVTTSLPLLLVFACIHGVFWSAIMSSSAAIMSEIIPASRRTEGIAWWGLASTAAVAVAPLVGLMLYRGGWQWVSGTMVALSCVMLAMSFQVRGGGRPVDQPFPRLGEVIDWHVVVTGLTLFVMSFAYGGITSYVAVYSMRQGVEPRSLFFTVFALAIILVRLTTSRLGDRHGPRFLLIPSLLLIPLSLAVLAVADSRFTFGLAAVFFGGGMGAAYPAFTTYVLNRTDEARRAATFGSILFAFDMGIGAGSLTIGAIADRSGFPMAFGIAAVLSTTAVPIFLITSRMFLEKRADVMKQDNATTSPSSRA